MQEDCLNKIKFKRFKIASLGSKLMVFIAAIIKGIFSVIMN